jgi:hypothetical protein
MKLHESADAMAPVTASVSLAPALLILGPSVSVVPEHAPTLPSVCGTGPGPTVWSTTVAFARTPVQDETGKDSVQARGLDTLTNVPQFGHA